MAGAIPERTIEHVDLRGGTRSLAFPRPLARRWLPPILLALATALAVVAAYAARPSVTIDVGDYYDTPFLPQTAERDEPAADFYAREVGPAGPEQVIAWPAGQHTLDVPGGRQGLWQVTVQAPRDQPGALEGLTLSVNGVRLWLPRGSPDAFVAIVPPELAVADTWQLRVEPGIVGDPMPETARVGQISIAPSRTYRWTSGQSTIRLPGLGRGDWVVLLTGIVRHPDGQPLDATIAANGTPIGHLPEGGARRLALLVPAGLVPDGDLTLTVSAKTYTNPQTDRRALGVLLYEISVTPAGGLPLLPPAKFLLYALAIALGLYVCLLRMTGRAAPSAALALLVVIGGAWALATARYPTAFLLPRLALLALWSVALLLALERLLAWAFRRAGAPLSVWMLRALLLTFFVGYWIKAGGMLSPYFVGIDMRLQMIWVRQMFNGNFWLYYGTNNPMNFRTMPLAAWGPNRPVIPYSPWFHIFAGSFLLLPLPMALTGHMFSALVDTSRVFLISLLARKGGFSERESLFAALLYAVTPVTFLLHSWGNLPTTFGIWWTLVCTVFIVAAYRRLDQPWPFVALTLLLLITTLIYTVMAVFMMLFLALLVPALWLVRRTTKDQRPRIKDQGPIRAAHGSPTTFGRSSFVLGHTRENRSIAAIALSALAAIGLTTLIYYGQYIPVILARTIPYFLGGSSGRPAGLQEHQPLLAYLASYWPTFGYLRRPVAYGLQIALLLGVVGLFGLRSRRMRALILCWAAVAALFVVAGSRIDMVDKQIFYFVPALALLAGPLLSRLWARGRPARLAVASIYLFTFVTALDLWVFRIVATRQ